MQRALRALAPMVVLSFLAACPRNQGTADAGQVTDPPACTTAASCPVGQNCVNGACVAPTPSCTRGTEDCACAGIGECSLGSDGTRLLCAAGICTRPPCTAGTQGCACDDNAMCGADLMCSAASGTRRCEPSTCVVNGVPSVGTLGCGCRLDRSCDQGACQLGVCTQLTCVPGSLGCACTASYQCAQGLECDLSVEICAPQGSCTPGSLGCQCNNDQCSAGLTCRSGQCENPVCPAGGLGCACRDGTCGTTAAGEALECVAGVCQQNGCIAGSLGCACHNGITCDAANTLCIDGFCRSQDCTPGSLGCDCLAGSCQPGLACAGAVCVDQTGHIGGPCRADMTCMRNARCDTSVSSPSCVYCDLGMLFCQCRDDSTCNPGLQCLSGYCVGNETIQGRTAPPDPKCYTPCQQDLDATHRCDPEGLMEGCHNGLQCVSGSCIAAGGVRPVCFQDSDCPDFQQCIQGYCYSECDGNQDCAAGTVCRRKVCRQPCSLSQSSCPAETTCESQDGDTGFCLPRAPSGAAMANIAPPAGGFSLSAKYVRLSNVATEARITFENHSPEFVTFKVTKNNHNALLRNGTADTRRAPGPGTTCTGASCPLWWLEFGEFGQITQGQSVEISAPPMCEVTQDCPVMFVRMAGSGGVDATRWSGALDVSSAAGTERVELEYVERPDGQWAGKMVYFATFDDTGIDSQAGVGRGWLQRNRDYVSGEPGVNTDLAVVNGLLLRWQAFRTGGLSGGWDEFKAVLTATEAEQWRFPNVKQACRLGQGACYLYADSSVGAAPRDYVTSIESSPIPTGATTFPMVMNLRIPNAAQPGVLEGRVDSATALHYAGNPRVALRFQADPANTAGCDPSVTSNCVHLLNAPVAPGDLPGLELEVAVGGRFPKTTGQACPQGFVEHLEPWLVPGFLDDAQPDGAGAYQRSWCVDFRLPAYTTPLANITPETRVDNMSLARGNPVPNGRVLHRTVELLDGAMIDQRQMFLLFRERYPSFLGGKDLVAYGYMVMDRKPAQLQLDDENGNGIPDDVEGTVPPANLSTTPQGAGVTCSRDILNAALGAGRNIQNVADAAAVVTALIEGSGSGTVPLSPPTGTDLACTSAGVEVHYFCEDTGLFNGGRSNTACWGSGNRGPNTDSCTGRNANGACEDGGVGASSTACAIGTDVTDCGFRYNDPRTVCPSGSNVTYFTADASQHDVITQHVCQQTGTCGRVLSEWATSGGVLRAIHPRWACKGGAASCDSNLLDRRDGKQFFDLNVSVPFTALRPELEDAFRYKTRFGNRQGSTLGFTPSICIPFSDATPYCYDPEAIEGLRERTDCLLDIYKTWYAQPSTQNAALYAYLEESFSRRAIPNPQGGLPSYADGFEKLYSELLIMLGDDAYTSSFESRFDLAGMNLASFQGDQFEDNGIAVSGIAGFEMARLHQAVQYYSMSLDRFYKMSDVVAAALASGSPSSAINFLSAETVTSYFQRLIRASTQRSRAWAEIARRYQGFNRPDLARRVAIRAYTITYLESIALSNIILHLYDISGGTNKPQILLALENAQRQYKMALLDLGRAYLSIADEVNFFGFAPDYVPFPALGTSGTNADVNAFEYVYQVATTKLEAAKAREQAALGQTREFDTDQASFQAELTRIARTYESQLGDICGAFTAPNGHVYPAINRYAYLHPLYVLYDDPCGYVGNGAIHEAILEADIARIEVERTIHQMEAVHARIAIEKARVEATCNVRLDIADFQYRVGQTTFGLDTLINLSQNIIDVSGRLANVAHYQVDALDCDLPGPGAPGDCPGAAAEASAKAAASSADLSTAITQMGIQAGLRAARSQIELSSARWVAQQDCTLAAIDLNAETARLILELSDLQIGLIGAEYRVALALSQISKARQQAQRIQLEEDEALQLSINVEAAKHDPNVRIYRNDSVINAEVSFDAAIKEAYRLTLVYEYYTSQSYGPRDQLFLTRMVSSGDYNLENYVADLRTSFLAFEEEFGNPDTRVMMVSLRDDIFSIPRNGEDGRPLANNQRATRMRERLLEPTRLNKDGYITLPFATRADLLSPLTRNHKVLYMEANIEGSDNGDFLGRLYVRQVGTSTVNSVNNSSIYYRFPPLTAVINPFFSGTREFASSPEVYRNYRLRDRPLVNNNWELIINQRDEAVNKDINLNALTDIKLYIYYTDFTAY